MARTIIIALCILGISATAGTIASRSLDIRLSEREAVGEHVPQAMLPASRAPVASILAGRTVAAHRPLPMRLVDAGGVGIDADTAAWGGSYSHGTGAFHSLIRPGTAQLDTNAFTRIERDWRTYIDRMSAYGNNGVVVGAFLELIDFDRVGDGEVVYGRGDAHRQRHAALRGAFGQLFSQARAAGIDVYLKTDMLSLTPPLERLLRERIGHLDTNDPALWRIYAAGVDELFERMPEVRGVVIRTGEAGALYNAERWPYRSVMAVRTPSQLRQMLNTLLPVFERHDRQLVLRSWSVGIGGLGGLHTEPAVYNAVLGDIASPALVVSTKFTRGDYFSHLPLNPTLRAGGHRRLIEFQARREFEGFGAIPNYLGGDHARALRGLLPANPAIAGMSLWTQEGGPLHAGPLSLYPVHGFWRWIDANVYATSRLARDPLADPTQLAAAWVRETISTDPVVVQGMTELLLRSRPAIEKALYVRPFAQRRVRAGGIEATPLMWIMEWDVIGDWSAVSSTVYRAARGRLDATIAEGFDAVRDVDAMREILDRLAPRMHDDPGYSSMVRSLDYEHSLFLTLAWYRSTLLKYYRWLDTGEAHAHSAWRASAERFRTEALRHTAGFADDLDFPAWDFAPALASLDRAAGSAAARDGARVTLALLALLLVAGTWYARAGSAAGGAGEPVHEIRDREQVRAWLIGLTTAATCGLTLWMLFAFQAPAVAGGAVILLGVFAAALKGGWSGPSLSVTHWDGHAASSTAPLLVGACATLSLIGVRGPDWFWFRFWADHGFRALAFTVAAVVMLWTLVSAHATGQRVAGAGRTRALGVALAAAGTTLIVLSAMLPDLDTLLASLDQPLGLLPFRFAMIVAITSYANVPAIAPWYPAMFGAFLLAAGILAARLPSSRRMPIAATRQPAGDGESTIVSDAIGLPGEAMRNTS